MKRVLCIYLSLLVVTLSGNAGTTTQFHISKDPQALSIVETALTAMGASSGLLSYQDSQASGTVTTYGTSTTSYPIILKCKGTQETRVEVQLPKGINIRIVNQGQGVIEKPDGTVITLVANNTLAERVNHIPLLSILAEYQNSNMSVQYEGTAQVNGQIADVVAVSFIPTTDPTQAQTYASMTQTLFFVNQSTGLVDKIQYTNQFENNSTTETIEVYFSGYQIVNGISVPFHEMIYAGGVLDSEIVLTMIKFNQGLPDDLFALPVGGNNVH